MDSGKAVHLFNLAHFGAFNPFLSKHAIVLDLYAYEYGINLPAGYSHCDQCGLYQVAGLTSSLRINYLTSQKLGRTKKKTHVVKSAPRQRQLHVTCLSCRFVKIHHTKQMSVAESSKRLDLSTETNKKKKIKRSELSSLLKEKKNMLNLSPLSLMEFMQR